MTRTALATAADDGHRLVWFDRDDLGRLLACVQHPDGWRIYAADGDTWLKLTRVADRELHDDWAAFALPRPFRVSARTAQWLSAEVAARVLTAMGVPCPR